MSELKVNKITSLSSNVELTIQSISNATEKSNSAIALAIALGV